jgi:hypothetical protein
MSAEGASVVLWLVCCHWTQGLLVQTWPMQWIFKGEKNLQHTFLRMGSKAGGIMS